MPPIRSWEASNTRAFIKQGRPKHACSQCQESKRKCHTSGKGSPCKRCLRLNSCCSIVAPIDAKTHSGPVIGDVFLEILPRPEVCNELVDLYFDIIHDKDHSLFHRPSFITAQRQGLADMMHIFAILALAARFFETSELRDRARVWADHSKRLFNSRTEAVSLTAIQACVLLGTIAFGEGDMEMESLYGAQAIRMVQLKGLSVALSSNAIQRETEIRVWWTVWMMDNWTSAGARIPRQLTIAPNFPAPMEERDFEKLSHEGPILTVTTTSDTAGLQQYGLWAQMIPLTEVIAPINEIHELSVQNRLSDDQLFERIDQISYKLDSWKLNLPSSLHFTPEARKSYAATGHGRILAALHTGFHHFSQLLYYQFLQRSISNTAGNNLKIDKYAGRCRQHAAELSNLLWIAKQTPGCECSWPMIGHLLAISSSVHLHSLLFDDNESNIANAKHMLKQNFEMMIFLRQYWPSIDLSMSRLRAFHQACQQSMNMTFKMDYWMLQFLQRYTKPVGHRDASIFWEIGNPADICSALPSTMVNHQDYNFGYNDSQHDRAGLSIGSRILKSFL